MYRPDQEQSFIGAAGFDVVIIRPTGIGVANGGDLVAIRCIGMLHGQDAEFTVSIPATEVDVFRRAMAEAEARCMAARQQRVERSQPESGPATVATPPPPQGH